MDSTEKRGEIWSAVDERILVTYLTKNSTNMFGVTFLIMVQHQVKGILQGILSH